MSAVVSNACDDESRAFMREHDVLVHQHAQAQPPELCRPRRLARVVLMITGDEVRAIPCAEPPQRRGMARKVAYRTIDDVAGHGDEVRLEVVYSVYDGIDVR